MKLQNIQGKAQTLSALREQRQIIYEKISQEGLKTYSHAVNLLLSSGLPLPDSYERVTVKKKEFSSEDSFWQEKLRHILLS
jgi:hypothetical protein